MKKFNGKFVVGAALAISLGGFTIPASASVPPSQPTKYVSKKVGGIQLAQVARDIDEKADEVHNGATGAVNAVDAAHRRHERNEYRHHTIEGKVDGAILSLVDIDVLKRHVDQAEWARDYAVSVVDAVLVPLVVLDEQLHVISANDAFYESFGGAQSETEDRSFFALARGEWDIPALRTSLKDLFAKRTPFEGLEVEGEFPRVGQRTMSFSARSVRFRDHYGNGTAGGDTSSRRLRTSHTDRRMRRPGCAHGQPWSCVRPLIWIWGERDSAAPARLRDGCAARVQPGRAMAVRWRVRPRESNRGEQKCRHRRAGVAARAANSRALAMEDAGLRQL